MIVVNNCELERELYSVLNTLICMLTDLMRHEERLLMKVQLLDDRFSRTQI